ncbi:MAG: hypothetical protein WCO88_03025 [Actinomycetota bacterium]
MTTWTAQVAVSEYRSVAGLVLTPTLGDGLDFVAGSASLVIGGTPVPVVPAVNVNGSGTTTLSLALSSLLTPAQLAAVGARNATFSLTFQSVTRANYRSTGTPVLVFDTLATSISVAGTTSAVDPVDGSSTQSVSDSASASIASEWSQASGLSLRALSGADASNAPGGLGCSDGSPRYGGSTMRYLPGAVMCFELTWKLPANLAVRNPLVTFVQNPAASFVGFAGYSNQLADSVVKLAGGVTPGDTLQFAVGTNPSANPRFSAADETFHIVVAERWSTDPTIAKSTNDYAYRLKATGTGTDGSAVSFRTDTSVSLFMPDLTPAVSVNDVQRDGVSLAGFPTSTGGSTGPSSLREGDRVTYQFDIKNGGWQGSTGSPSVPLVDPTTGRQAADASAVEDWVVLPSSLGCSRLDPLPTDLSGAATLVLNGGALAFAAAPQPVVTSLTCSTSSNVLKFSVDTIPAGYTLRLLVTATVPTGAAAGFQYAVKSGVRTYQNLTVSPAQVFWPSSNIDSTVPSASFNVGAASNTNTSKVSTASVALSGVDSLNESGNNATSQATIGETVSMRAVVTVPAGTTVYDGVATFAVPTGFVYVANSAEVTTSDGSAPQLSQPANGWKLDFSTATNGWHNDTTSAYTATVTFQAKATDVATSIAGSTVSNSVGFMWYAQHGSIANRTTVNATAPWTIVEPLPTVQQSITPNTDVVGGVPISVAITAGNTLSRSPLHDVVAEACAPAAFENVVPSAVAAPSTVAVGDINSCTNGGRLITWTLAGNEPTGLVGGTAVTLGYTATTAETMPAGGVTPSVVTVKGSSMSGNATGERSYSAQTTTSLTMPNPSVTAQGPSTRSTGQDADETVTIAVPARTSAFDLAVSVQIPAGMTFAQYLTSPPTYESCMVVNQAGHVVNVSGQVAGWFLGDVVAGATPCVITMSLRATVSTTATPGSNLTTQVATKWNLADQLIDLTTFSGSSFGKALTENIVIGVTAPSLAITRTIDDSDRAVAVGQLVTHTFTLTNTGNEAMHAVVLNETLPAGIAAVEQFGGTCADAATPNMTSSAIAWTLFSGFSSLAPGATCTVTFRERIGSYPTVGDAQAITSTVTVPSYTGDSVQLGQPQTYVGPTVPLTVTAYRPTVTMTNALTVTSGDAPAVATATVGQPTSWTLTATNVSPTTPTGVRIARAVTMSATLPANWNFSGVDTSKTSVCARVPAVETVANGVKTETWTTTCDLAPTQKLTLVYTATPQAGASLVDAQGTRFSHTVIGTATGHDEATNPIGPTSANAVAVLRSTDLRVVTSDASTHHDGSPTSAGFLVGMTGTYFVDVNNEGPDSDPGPITVTDDVPAGFIATAASGSGWACTLGSTVVCTRPGPVAANQVLPRITIVGSISTGALNDADGDKNPATGLIANVVSVMGGEVDRDPSNNTDLEPTPVVRSSDMAVAVQWSPTTPFVAGTRVDYLVTVRHLGPSPATGVVRVTDLVPAGAKVVNVRGAGWNCAASRGGFSYSDNGGENGTIDCSRTVTELAVGAVLDQLIVSVQVDPAFSGSMAFTAQVAHPNDQQPSNDSAQVSGSAAAVAELTLVGAAGGEQFVVGQSGATAMFVVSNQGPSTEQGPVVVSAGMPAGFRLTSVAGTGWTCETIAATGFAAGTTGSFVCTFTGSDSTPDAVPAGTTLSAITVTADVGAAAVADSDPTVAHTLTIDAKVMATTQPTAVTASVHVPVFPVAELSVVSSHAPSTTLHPGERAQVSLAVANRGPSGEYGPVQLTEQLPAGVRFVATTSSGWECTADAAATTVSCGYARDLSLDRGAAQLAAGASLPVLTLTVEVGADAISGSTPDTVSLAASTLVRGVTDAEIHHADDSFAVAPEADLSIERISDGTHLAVGQSGTYRLKVSNSGPNASAAGIVVTDHLPEGITPVSSQGDGWNCGIAGGALQCTIDHPLAVGDSTEVAISVAAAAKAYTGSDLAGTVDVKGPNHDTNASDNSAKYALSIDPLVDLAVAPVEIPALLTGYGADFTITVGNRGPNTPDAVVTVTNQLPDGMSYRSASGDGWKCDYVGQTLTCTRSSSLALSHDLPSITVGVLADTVLADGAVNTVAVSAPPADADTTNNTATTTLSVRAPGDPTPSTEIVAPVDDVTPPTTTEPATSTTAAPTSSEPATTEPATTERSTTAVPTSAATTSSAAPSTEPGTTALSSTMPSTTEPGTTESSPTEPGTTEPSTTEPGTTEPDATETPTTEMAVVPMDDATTPPQPGTLISPQGDPNLEISLSLLSSIVAGGPSMWRISVVNSGSGPAANATVTQTFPNSVVPQRGDAPDGPCSVIGQSVHCTANTIAPGEHISFDVVATAQVLASTAPFTIRATVSTPVRETTMADNVATIHGAVLPVATGHAMSVAQQDEQAGGLDLPDFLSSLIGMSGIAMVAMMFYLVAFRQRGLRTIMDAWRAVARS